MKAFVRWTLAVVLLTGAAVVAEPSQRGTSTRVGLLLVAVGGALALVGRLRRALPDTIPSLLEPPASQPVPPPVPSGLRDLVTEVHALQAVRRTAARTDRPGRLPGGLRATGRTLVADRLARLGLDPADPADEVAVRAALGPVLAGAVLDADAVDPDLLADALEAR